MSSLDDNNVLDDINVSSIKTAIVIKKVHECSPQVRTILLWILCPIPGDFNGLLKCPSICEKSF